jgi:hypothetical protein
MIKIIKLLFLLFTLIASYDHDQTRKMKILKTPVLGIDCHDVVLVKHNNKYTYAIDFSPTNQPHYILKLLCGMRIPAMIRIVKFHPAFFDMDTQQQKQHWKKATQYQNATTTNQYSLLDSAERTHVERWKKDTIHLYTHNCKHFSHYYRSLQCKKTC